MERQKSTLIQILRVLSTCIALISLLWWVMGSSNEPQWLFYPSLFVSLILAFLERGKRQEQRERAKEIFEDIGRSTASYEQAARDREQKKFRLGAYRATIRVFLSEEDFIRLLEQQADRLGSQTPEIQTDGERRRILMKQARFFANAANRVKRSIPNIEFDITRLHDTGEVDVCAWVPPLTWVPSILLAIACCAFEALAFLDKAPLLIHLFLFLFIGIAAAIVPGNIRFWTKSALRDLQRQMAILYAEAQP